MTAPRRRSFRPDPDERELAERRVRSDETIRLCPSCDGWRLDDDGQTCPECIGKGVVEATGYVLEVGGRRKPYRFESEDAAHRAARMAGYADYEVRRIP